MRLFIFSASLVILFSGCMLITGTIIQGSGIAATENRVVDDFNAIDISGASSVSVKIGDEKSVVVKFDDNLMEILKTEVSGGTLRIYSTANYKTSVGLTIDVITPSLDDIELSGASEVNVTGVSGESMKVNLSGASQATVSGSVGQLDVDTSGASTADLSALLSSKASVSTSGASNVTVSVSDAIRVSSSGASKVRVLGNPPETKQDTSGAANVEFVNE